MIMPHFKDKHSIINIKILEDFIFLPDFIFSSPFPIHYSHISHFIISKYAQIKYIYLKIIDIPFTSK